MDNYNTILEKFSKGYFKNKSNIKVVVQEDMVKVVTNLSDGRIKTDFYFEDGEQSTFVEKPFV